MTDLHAGVLRGLWLAVCAGAPLQHDDREEGNSAPQSMTGEGRPTVMPAKPTMPPAYRFRAPLCGCDVLRGEAHQE